MASVELPLSLWLLLLLAGLKTSFAAEKVPEAFQVENCSEEGGDVTFKDVAITGSGLSGTFVVKKPITNKTSWQSDITINNGQPHTTEVEANDGEWEGEKDPFFEALGLPSQPPIKVGEYKFSNFKTDMKDTEICKDGRKGAQVKITESFTGDVTGTACLVLEAACE